MSISSSTSRTTAAPRPAAADPTTAPAQQKAAGAASEAASAGKATAAEAPKTDQFVAAPAQGSTSKSLGVSTAKPSKAMDLSKLVKPAENFLLRISETRGPQVAAEMRALDKSIDAKARDGSTALGPAGEGTAKAIDETTNRVLARLSEGKITPDEAKQAFQQIDLLADAVKCVKDGKMENVQKAGVCLLDDGSKGLNFDFKKGNDTYTATIVTTPERTFGEARIGFNITKKNGEPIPWSDQVSLRCDHARVDDKVEVDVASSLLDKKIHGAMLDPSGKPVRDGKVPDHHFATGFPESMNNPAEFKKFVEDFRGKYLDAKEAQAPNNGIAFQTDNKVSLEAIAKFQGAETAKKLGAMNDSIDALAKDSAKVFGPASDAAGLALDRTTDKILGRVAEGTLLPQEAEQAMGQVKIAASMLQALQGGKLEGLQQAESANKNDPTYAAHSFQMKVGEDTYTVKVKTREERGQGGDARVGLSVTEKNGEKLGPLDQVDLRLDYQRMDNALSLDFSSKFLDMKVHGMLDPALTHDGRRGVPNHHFQEALPKQLEDGPAFSSFVKDFRNSYLKAA